MNIKILRFSSVDSTNAEALREAKRGAAEGLCIVAREQTDGRGRLGREWRSEKDAGIYLSIILRPVLEPDKIPLITLAAAVAVHETIETDLGLVADIKWPNDVLVDQKKICGILAETMENALGIAVILGVGLNVGPGNLTVSGSGSITSIENETGSREDLERLLRIEIEAIDSAYEMLRSPGGGERVVAEWKKRSTYHSGKRVRVRAEGLVWEGTTDGLEANGALRVMDGDGKVLVFPAGDVSELRVT